MMRMVRYIMVALGMVLCIGSSCQDGKPETIIRTILANQQDAWNAGDLDRFMEGYWKSDALIFVGSKGINRGWKTTLESYKKSYPDKASMGTLTMTIVSLEMISKASAFVVGKWKLNRQQDSPEGYFTLLWEIKEGQWVIVADHSS